MSFCNKSLVRRGAGVPVGSTAGAAQSNQSNRWDYATDDAAATVEVNTYFAAALAYGLAKGDTIDAVMAVSGTPVRKNYVVTAVTTTTVTLAVQATALG